MDISTDEGSAPSDNRPAVSWLPAPASCPDSCLCFPGPQTQYTPVQDDRGFWPGDTEPGSPHLLLPFEGGRGRLLSLGPLMDKNLHHLQTFAGLTPSTFSGDPSYPGTP